MLGGVEVRGGCRKSLSMKVSPTGFLEAGLRRLSRAGAHQAMRGSSESSGNADCRTLRVLIY
jgi:hypothetical protein